MNRLVNETSLYLRHASLQKIDWYAWSDEAFEAARRQDKPVFLSSGAAWCHWCHVMAKESFEDEETVRRLNEDFICIKLDRDERPDIDRRYQQVVAAMGNGSGWPLSVFLTPDREAFYGGTYFPPLERQGRPGFRQVLAGVLNFYRTRKSEVAVHATSIMATLESDVFTPEEPQEALLDEAEAAILSQFDPEHAGFGTAPKFPMPGAIEFLLRRYAAGGHDAAGEAARKTLLAMANGGFHDQLGGGFHRYSVDAAWMIPHFEKMADDNAGLLRNYVEGFALFGDERFREAAHGIIRFTSAELAAPEGGFGASQDADVTPDDEGGYFTWTDEELREALSPEEYQLVSLHLVPDGGRMHHDPGKTVLAVNRQPLEIARAAGKDVGSVVETISKAKEALLARRKQRPAPVVDRALYPSLNGMLAAAWFRASMALDDSGLCDTAEQALERVLRERMDKDGLLHAPGVKALLEDYIHLTDAFIAGYEATGRRYWLEQAEGLMNRCMQKFLDPREGGFFDTEEDVLGTRWKRMEDTPHPSANAVAIQVLLKLWFMTGEQAYRQEAERSLKLFAGPARSLGVHGGTYFSALTAYYHWSTLTVETAPQEALAREARATAGRSYASLAYGQDLGRVIACTRGVCSPPITDARVLRRPHQQAGIP